MTLIIPAIDLLDGKAVRLHQGRYDQVTVFDDDPVGRARLFRDHGATRLHVVDLEGARSGKPAARTLIEEIVRAFGEGVQIGGGIRTREIYEGYLAAGARRIVVGTRAVEDAALVGELAAAHPDTAILAVDAEDGIVKTQGWTESSGLTAVELLARFDGRLLSGVLYTDIARDGTGVGPNVAATLKLADETGLHVIASGGVGSLAHIDALHAAGIGAVIVGRALYDGKIPLSALRRP